MGKINKRNKWTLSVGCVGRDLCYTLVSLFLLTYLQFTGMFNTSQFLVLTIIIVLCRIWDAINDPMMGTIITNTKTRFGKYRPWLIIGAILNAVVLILMFSVRFNNGWGNVAFIGTMYLLWGMTFTMNDIAYWDLLPTLTSDKKERDNLTSLVAVFASVGAFISGGVIPIVTPGNMVVAYRIISIVCALVFLGCTLLTFFGVHDNKYDAFIEPKEDEMGEIKDEKVTLKGMVKILLGNKQLVVMAIVIFLYSLGSAILTAFGQNFFYFKFGYTESASGQMSGGTMMTIFTVIYALGTILSQAIYPLLASKFKRNVLVKYSLFITIISYVLFFLLANLLQGMVCFIILCSLGIVIFSLEGVFYLTMLVMLTNTIEYDELETGTNHSAIAFTVRPFMVKLAGAFQYGIVALTLIICGLNLITNNVGDVEVAIGMFNESNNALESINYLKELGHDVTSITGFITLKGGDTILGLQAYASSLFEITSGQMWGLTAAMCFAPIICFAIALIVIKRKYIIDEDMYENILKELAKRKEANL